VVNASAHDTYCSFCRRQPCRCDADAGDERHDADAGELLDVGRVLRAYDARERREYRLQPMTVE
jgi:hypothetical protein